MQDIQELEKTLWEAADQLRANSKLTATEYSLPVLGLIFLRHATTRYHTVKAEIFADPKHPKRKGMPRELDQKDFIGKSAIYLAPESQYETLVELPDNADIGQAIVTAMTKIEETKPDLQGALPKTYGRFEPDLLRRLLRIFNSEVLQKATGDVFGRIYEYFLNKFAMTGAQEGGEFFTPMALVKTIVNIIEPKHGKIFDPAAGSCGMFVQTGYFLQTHGFSPSKSVTFYAQEKSDTNTNLARLNLAVHGLEGNVQQGNTYYDRRSELIGACSAVMANPPFNVDGVDPKRIENDPRLFTQKKIPGLNQKSKMVSNANYLWIQYFYSYLNEEGRAGFVMASSATDAGHGEREIRREIIQTGHVDVIIAIGTNFFYTRSLPCTLWFFDKGKPPERTNTVLMIDARAIYRVVTRKIRDFTDEQLENISAIVWLYRDEKYRYLQLIRRYFAQTQTALTGLPTVLANYFVPLADLQTAVAALLTSLSPNQTLAKAQIADFTAQTNSFFTQHQTAVQAECTQLLHDLATLPDLATIAANNAAQHAAHATLAPFVPRLKSLPKSLLGLVKEATHLRDSAEKLVSACLKGNGRKALVAKADSPAWDSKAVRATLGQLETARDQAIETIKESLYFLSQIHWLQSRFPAGEYADVLGLCKAVDRATLYAHDDSLTPGRYVGVAPQEEEDDDDFAERMREIHLELVELNAGANELATLIQTNLIELL